MEIFGREYNSTYTEGQIENHHMRVEMGVVVTSISDWEKSGWLPPT